MEASLVIRNATVVTAADVWPLCDIAIKDGSIVAVGTRLAVVGGAEEIDAEGAYVTPGGVDTHVHLAQWHNPPADQPQRTIPTNGQIPHADRFAGDPFSSGTASAIAGGTTTVISFAQQFRDDESLIPVLDEYHKLAAGQTYCDYSFHVIVTNPTRQVLDHDLAAMVRDYGVTSVKLYMTYATIKLTDRQILDVLQAARTLGITAMVHAENADIVEWMTEQLVQRGLTAPHFHGPTRPPLVEAEATNRAVSLSELMGTPILLVHVSTDLAASVIRSAQTRLLAVHGETCPQYLYLQAEQMRAPGFEGAKYVCSPPLRENGSDLQAMWRGINNGTLAVVSSDHSPTSYNHPLGKQKGRVAGATGPDSYGSFQDIPNGLPGLETRLPLLFKGVLDGRITPSQFVQVTATNAAKLYGLAKKGVLAPGYDADVVIWYPPGKMAPFRLTNAMLHHTIDYTPYEGVEFHNWPRYTILRGKVVFREGDIVGTMADGRFVKRGKSTLSSPGPSWLDTVVANNR